MTREARVKELLLDLSAHAGRGCDGCGGEGCDCWSCLADRAKALIVDERAGLKTILLEVLVPKDYPGDGIVGTTIPDALDDLGGCYVGWRNPVDIAK